MKSRSLYAKRTWGLSPGIMILVITLVAFAARIWQLDSIPPGWRDDELINSLVISQKVLDGDWALYYPDASGHEALYHVMNAPMLAIFGPGAAGIRLLSAFLGTLAVPLLFLVGNRLFGTKVGLLAAAGLAISFWSLMYSRLGIRHISLPIFLLASFYFFLRGFGIANSKVDSASIYGRKMIVNFALAGFFLGLGFYTYFASRGAPIIFVVILIYTLIFHRQKLSQRWTGFLVMFAMALLLALPLLLNLSSQPESEARVQELAVPLVEAQEGNFQPLKEHIFRTLNMYHSDGDEEWLYNIPRRPLFSPLVAVVFWLGFGISTWFAIKPILRYLASISRRKVSSSWIRPTPGLEIAGAFLLTWWFAGIFPAFVSVPPASLGHTIIAQSATYIILALPVMAVARLGQRWNKNDPYQRFSFSLPLLFAGLLLISLASRDLPDYFTTWPSRGMTRFLYRADLKDLANYLNEHPSMTDFGVTGLLAGPWDRQALNINLNDEASQRPRWFNPERVVLIRVAGEEARSFTGYPLSTPLQEFYYEPVTGEIAGDYQLSDLKKDIDLDSDAVCFQNNLCLLEARYDLEKQVLDLILESNGTLDHPNMPLISNPPPPGVYSGPRLHVFSQLLDGSQEIISGDDGLWIDAQTIQPGDRFLQQHRFSIQDESIPEFIVLGLYDPMTGQRILTVDGRDHLQIQLND